MGYLSIEAIHWLNRIVYMVGLGVTVWAFMRSRKCGYLVLAVYFAVVLFSWFLMPSINDTIRAHQAPDFTEQTQQKIREAVQEATERVLKEQGQTNSVSTLNVSFPLGPIILVAGLWLLARREPDSRRPDNSIPPG